MYFINFFMILQVILKYLVYLYVKNKRVIVNIRKYQKDEFDVNTVIDHQSKCPSVPDCTYIDNMFIKSIHK